MSQPDSSRSSEPAQASTVEQADMFFETFSAFKSRLSAAQIADIDDMYRSGESLRKCHSALIAAVRSEGASREPGRCQDCGQRDKYRVNHPSGPLCYKCVRERILAEGASQPAQAQTCTTCAHTKNQRDITDEYRTICRRVNLDVTDCPEEFGCRFHLAVEGERS